jgi:crotonobetaine/carnitine-CoA ligase
MPMASPDRYVLPAPAAPRERWSLVHALVDRAEEDGGRVALRWTAEGQPWTFARLRDEVADLASRLAAAGLRPGERVLVLMRNSVAHVVTWLAVNWAGAVDFPVNPAFTPRYLADQLALIRPGRAICDESLRELLSEALSLVDDLDPVIHVHADEGGDVRERLAEISGLAEPDRDLAPPSIRPHDVASILSTSGTTGPSKGVQMPHAQLFFYSWQTQHLHAMTDRDVYLAPYPLFHASARIHGVGSALVSGAQCVLYDRFSASRFAHRAAASQATVTHFLGSMMTLVLKDELGPEVERQLELRSVMALPTPARLVAEFRRRFGVENVTEVIGMTELSWPVMTPYGANRPAGAAGLAVGDWYDVAVVDPGADLPVDRGDVGELVVRPKAPWIVSAGYENAPQATVQAWRNLWFHSGDLVRQDDDGWFYYVDRLKDSIRRRGENISSHEVEEALRAAPDVSDVAVVGRRLLTDELDEEVVAFVVAKNGAEIDLAGLGAQARQALPPYAVPAEYRLVTELPMTPSGKVRKSVLRDLARSNV